MKKTQMTLKASVMLLAAGMLLQGCSAVSSITESDRPGYEAGRITVVAYVATENVLPDEAQVACKIGYAVLSSIYGDESVEADAIDALVDAKIAEMLADEELPQLAVLAKGFYVRARNKIESALAGSDVSLSVYLDNFEAGITDALSDYGVTTSTVEAVDVVATNAVEAVAE
jgi:hypothetical protein